MPTEGPEQILLTPISSGSKTLPFFECPERVIAEVEWLNFLNKILVENQCHPDASSF